MAGVGHRQGAAADATGRGDRLLGHHPAARATTAAMRPHHHGGVVHVQEQEAAEGQVDRLGQDQVLAGLGQGDHLGVGGRGRAATSSRASGSLSTA